MNKKVETSIARFSSDCGKLKNACRSLPADKKKFEADLGAFFASLRLLIESMPELNADAVINAAEKSYNKPKTTPKRKSLKSK